MQLFTPNTRPIGGTTKPFISLWDAFRQASRRGLEKQIFYFLEDASPEEIAFLGEVFTVRNQPTSGDFRLAGAIDWVAGNFSAIPAGSSGDKDETFQGWAIGTNEETKQPATGVAA